VTTRSSEVNFTKNYTLLYVYFLKNPFLIFLIGLLTKLLPQMQVLSTMTVSFSLSVFLFVCCLKRVLVGHWRDWPAVVVLPAMLLLLVAGAIALATLACR